MGNDGIDDIFKDFEYKVAGKKDAAKSDSAPQIAPRKLSRDEEILEEKYAKEQEILEKRYDKEKEIIGKKRKEDSKKKMGTELRENILRQKSMPSQPANKNSINVERIGYWAIILVLVSYIIIDLSFYHSNSDVAKNRGITVLNAPVKNTTPNATISQNLSNKSKEVKVVEEKKEETTPPAAEEKKLSGKILLKIDDIATEASKISNDTGYINNVAFTIENGKDKLLSPIVDVYAYDSKLDVSWETRSRGQYKGIAINPGEKYAGSLSLTPKSFNDLKLERTIRLSLNDTKDGFIAAVNKKVIIS